MKVVTLLLPFQSTEEFETNPVPLSVSVGATLPGAALTGVKGCCKEGTGFAPVPDNATVCGLPLALSVTDKDPERVPKAVG
jgi:hypothetical protein